MTIFLIILAIWIISGLAFTMATARIRKFDKLRHQASKIGYDSRTVLRKFSKSADVGTLLWMFWAGPFAGIVYIFHIMTVESSKEQRRMVSDIQKYTTDNYSVRLRQSLDYVKEQRKLELERQLRDSQLELRGLGIDV